MRTIVALILMSPLGVALADSPAAELWGEVLGKTEGTVAADPGGKVEWRTDFAAALEEAGETGRPLLVTWRCLPCEQCAEFDNSSFASPYRFLAEFCDGECVRRGRGENPAWAARFL